MSKETKKVRTLTRIVNPAHVPGGNAEAVFAAGAEISVPAELADKWINGGQAEAVENSKEDEVTIDEKVGAKKRKTDK